MTIRDMRLASVGKTQGWIVDLARDEVKPKKEESTWNWKIEGQKMHLYPNNCRHPPRWVEQLHCPHHTTSDNSLQAALPHQTFGE